MSEPINTRSPQQWEIISKHIDFKGKTVIDLGCGYGDLLFEYWGAGAAIAGIDNNQNIINSIWKWFNKFHIVLEPFELFCCNIEELPIYIQKNPFDVSICFSVLPYLKDSDNVLAWMRDHSEIALIECQYAEDGPGFDHIKNDADMEAWLRSIGWRSVEMIGRTLVVGRNKERSIWLCR